MIRTQRLILRKWQQSDRKAFAEINSDPKVMQFFPSVLSEAESDALADRIESHFAKYGWGLFAVQTEETPFIGFIGLQTVRFKAHFTPAIEIGYRLGSDWWGKGYASEAGRAVLDFAFNEAALDRVVSFTAVINMPSIRVMESIGLNKVEEFDHPLLDKSDRLSRHVLYEKRASQDPR